ncbi:hypothetical protein LOAG_08880 [Loa loa]|uniref:Wsv095 n=1 Tax=Loa loa TaxID=7209 RepID=A0A1I7VXR8_LOALO|nr:hypothetical protein LOAG_08880 [Loa loa]EFO19614.1 hypothetical protein LOAG_08880 [Loa loa]
MVLKEEVFEMCMRELGKIICGGGNGSGGGGGGVAAANHQKVQLTMQRKTQTCCITYPSMPLNVDDDDDDDNEDDNNDDNDDDDNNDGDNDDDNDSSNDDNDGDDVLSCYAIIILVALILL